MGRIKLRALLMTAFEYCAVRDVTERLAEPLAPEDQVVQSMPDVSPTKWHRAHTTWFFETFILGPHLPGYEPFHPTYAYLFNSYYEAAGPRYTRSERGLLSRPTVAEVAKYRAYVDAAMQRLVVTGREPADLLQLGLHHEQQHQELLLMDIKHVLSRNPLHPAYDHLNIAAPGTPSPVSWLDFEGGLVAVGHDGDGFSFDNECPCHDTFLNPYRLADRPVTNGEWREFMADGGYQRPELWLSDGWYAVQSCDWTAPLYWEADDDQWNVMTLAGLRPVHADEPVCHVSHYEADAFARWAGARLPTEFEWEHAVVSSNVDPALGRFLATDVLHPRAAPPGSGLRQAYGDVWEWTASPYIAYPGFRTAEGAVGEYNGKFMSNQIVLRGGCCATPVGHVRATYRNFFPPSARWAFSGLRLATDA
jgi:ergothioneine biosynthesis protein EgtB